jgi:hypothetical protein
MAAEQQRRGWAEVPFRGGVVRVSRHPLPPALEPPPAARCSSPDAYDGFAIPGLDTMEMCEEEEEGAGAEVRRMLRFCGPPPHTQRDAASLRPHGSTRRARARSRRARARVAGSERGDAPCFPESSCWPCLAVCRRGRRRRRAALTCALAAPPAGSRTRALPAARRRARLHAAGGAQLPVATSAVGQQSQLLRRQLQPAAGARVRVLPTRSCALIPRGGGDAGRMAACGKLGGGGAPRRRAHNSHVRAFAAAHTLAAARRRCPHNTRWRRAPPAATRVRAARRAAMAAAGRAQGPAARRSRSAAPRPSPPTTARRRRRCLATTKTKRAAPPPTAACGSGPGAGAPRRSWAHTRV